MAIRGNAISDSNLENVGGGKTVYKFNNGNVRGAELELLGADGNVIGRFASEEERNRAIASMGADEIKQLTNWKQLNNLRKKSEKK